MQIAHFVRDDTLGVVDMTVHALGSGTFVMKHPYLTLQRVGHPESQKPERCQVKTLLIEEGAVDYGACAVGAGVDHFYFYMAGDAPLVIKATGKAGEGTGVVEDGIGVTVENLKLLAS